MWYTLSSMFNSRDFLSPPAIASLMKSIRLGVLAGVSTALLVVLLPNYYRSEARLLPVESKGVSGNFGGLASAAAALGVSVPGGDGSDANFVDILNSRWLREKLLSSEFEYQDRNWRFGSERTTKGTLYSYLDKKNMDIALKELASLALISRDIKTKVISISVETRSANLSRAVVNRFVQLLEEFLREKGRTRGGAKAVFANSRLTEARAEMDQAERLLLLFLQKNRNFQASLDPSVRLEGARLETELRLRQQLVSTLALNREQALLEEKNDIPILNLMDPANLPIEKSRPTRSSYVLFSTFLVGVVSWIWLNRRLVKDRLGSDEGSIETFLKEEK